jgi:hypothetical protein
MARFYQYKRFRFFSAAVVVFVLLAAYASFLWTIPPARVFTVLSARSEFVRFLVINPEFATLRITSMKALGPAALSANCIDGVVSPTIGARIEYRRGDTGYFRITIDPPRSGGPGFTFREKGAQPATFSQSVIFVESDTCGGNEPSRLPIWGPTQFGDYLRPPPNDGTIVPWALISGKVSVYARAHDRLIGLSFPPSIYLVTAFDLPPGSVLPAANQDDEGTDGSWTGTARADKEGAGFTVYAESEARSIVLRAAGTAVGPHDPGQLIDLGHYAQFLTDPNIIQIQFLCGAFLILINVFGRIMGFIDSKVFGADKSSDES